MGVQVIALTLMILMSSWDWYSTHQTNTRDTKAPPQLGRLFTIDFQYNCTENYAYEQINYEL